MVVVVEVAAERRKIFRRDEGRMSTCLPPQDRMARSSPVVVLVAEVVEVVVDVDADWVVVVVTVPVAIDRMPQDVRSKLCTNDDCRRRRAHLKMW